MQPNFDKRLDKALGMNKALGRKNLNLAAGERPDTGEMLTGSVHKFAKIPTIGEVAFLTGVVDGTYNALAIQVMHLQPLVCKKCKSKDEPCQRCKLHHELLKRKKVPANVIYPADKVLVGQYIGTGSDLTPKQAFDSMMDLMLHDWGYGTELN